MATTRALNLGSVVLPGNHLKLGSFIELELPHTDGLTDMYILGGSLEASRVNRVNPSERALVIGSPAIDPSGFGVTCNWSNCFDIGKQATASRTWIALSKPKTAADPGNSALACTILSNKNYVGSPARQTGDQLFWHQNPALNSVAETATSVKTRSRSASGLNASAWAAAVGWVDADAMLADAGVRQGHSEVQWAFGNKVIEGVRTTDGSDRTLRIGALATNADVGEKGDCDVGLILIFNKALSVPDINDTVDAIAAWAEAACGITGI